MIELEAMSQEPLSVMPRRVKCHGKEPVRVHFPQIEGRTSPIAFPGLSALMVGAKYFLSGRSIYDDCFTLVRLAAHRVRGSSQSRASVFSTPRHADRTVAKPHLCYTFVVITLLPLRIPYSHSHTSSFDG